MKKKLLFCFTTTGILLMLFIVLLVTVLTIDVQPIGPENSRIGLSTMNKAVFDFFKVNMVWYHITDWVSVIAVLVAFCFAFLGLVQLIRRKSIKKVDYNILLLGATYLFVIGCYIMFEFIVINYRPIILGEGLAASFPSSTVFIVVSIMGTAMFEFVRLFKKNKILKIISLILSASIIAITIIGRQISGVHWFSDILAGILLGAFFTLLYYSFVALIDCVKNKDVCPE